jgi:hypothetical protein
VPVLDEDGFRTLLAEGPGGLGAPARTEAGSGADEAAPEQIMRAEEDDE